MQQGRVDFKNEFDLSGRTAVVTGGGGLLGYQFCKALCQNGADVVVADVSSDAAAKTVTRLEEQGLAAQMVELDVTNASQVVDFFTGLGKVDVLVNSAAIDPKVANELSTKPTLEFAVEEFEAAIRVALVGTYLMTSAAINLMRSEQKGSIVNISSTYGLNGPDQRIYGCERELDYFKPAHYSASKAGVIGLTRYFAALCRGTDIRVNALAPGGVEHEQSEEFKQQYSSRTILGRMARKNEINGALLFLSSEASTYVTGSVVSVDGGWTAW